MTTKTTAADREQRLNEVLLAYVEAAQSGRPQDRDELIKTHPELRADLEEFFASHDEVERLTAPLRTNSSAAVEAECELGKLGDFRLIRELGRGGMGVVYEAEQISLKRRVALKMLPFAAAIDPRQLQRFRNEALAAANLRHEHIVPVHAVGCDRGVHYYAMQYVEGQSLAGLIAELRGPPGESSAGGQTTGPYSIAVVADTRPEAAVSAAASISRERSTGGRRYYRWAANLARQAALALEHAHQMGIVHRDIKPGNLLLDARGDLWVTDFGLAQFGADAGLTVTGEILGTLRYASPEQALARPGLVDHRSDVYSLGATLYELLTLRPIFDGRDRNTLLRQIANDEPQPPRAVNRNIPAELETVVLKAAGKEPADRYATAKDFADDLQRFLDDKPVLAKRPSSLEKATKWARRHRGVVVSAVAALLLTVAGLAVATALAARAYDRERTKSEEADEQRARAEENYRQARRAVELFERIGEEELAGRPDPQTQALRRRLLETALTYYQGFIDQRGDDPSARAELEASRDRAVRILGELTTLMGAGQYRILQEPDVQNDLGLTDEQKSALARYDDHRSGGMGEINLTPAEMERRVLARVQEQQAEVPKLLTPAQMRRFKQLSIQQRGPVAFVEAEVADALKLTPDQKVAIRAAMDEVMPKFGGPPGGGPPGSGGFRPSQDRPDDFLRKLEETRRRKTQEIVALLSPEQRRTWDELTGSPFQGRFQTPRLLFPRP